MSACAPPERWPALEHPAAAAVGGNLPLLLTSQTTADLFFCFQGAGIEFLLFSHAPSLCHLKVMLPQCILRDAGTIHHSSISIFAVLVFDRYVSFRCRHRRQHGLRQTLSGTLTRHGSASEMLSAMTAGHTAAASVSRRRRHSHRRSGSSGSVSALILSPTPPRTPPAPSAAADPSSAVALQPHAVPALLIPPDAAGSVAAAAVSAPWQEAAREVARAEREWGEQRAHAAVHSESAAEGPSEAGDNLSEPSEAGTWASPSPAASQAQLPLLPFNMGEGPASLHAGPSQPHLNGISEDRSPAADYSTSQAVQPSTPQPSGSMSDDACTADLPPMGQGTRGNALTKSAFQDQQAHSRAGLDQPEDDSVAGSSSPQNLAMAQLRVRSRLFSISDDVPERVSPYRMAGSPTDPFESAELLGLDSLPSSPFGESRAGDALLHSSDNALGLVSSGGEATHSSPDSLFARGRFMQTSDVAELLQTSCSGAGHPARWVCTPSLVQF